MGVPMVLSTCESHVPATGRALVITGCAGAMSAGYVSFYVSLGSALPWVLRILLGTWFLEETWSSESAQAVSLGPFRPFSGHVEQLPLANLESMILT